METPRDTLGTALDARAKGIVAVPCHPGTKVPMVAWKRWQTEMPPEELQRLWFRDTRVNVAILTTGMVVFDCDDPAIGSLVLRQCGETPHAIRTPRGGIHLGYRRRMGVVLTNRVKVKGLDLDVRTTGGVELVPPSRTGDGEYRWLGEGLKPISDLPCGNIGWFREPKRKPHPPHIGALGPGGGRIVHPEAYCLRIKSVQGSSGSRALVRAVCVLREAGRTPEQAFDFLWAVWNPACAAPAWSERELTHAIERHYGLK